MKDFVGYKHVWNSLLLSNSSMRWSPLLQLLCHESYITLLSKLPNYLGSFNTNYIIFRKSWFLKIKIPNIFFLFKKVESSSFFLLFFFKMKISKWIKLFDKHVLKLAKYYGDLGSNRSPMNNTSSSSFVLTCSLFTTGGSSRLNTNLKPSR